jgi:hypothetical protein
LESIGVGVQEIWDRETRENGSSGEVIGFMQSDETEE